jgi:hypothetical protein
MAGMMKRVAPLSYEAWIDYDVAGARLSRMELNALRLIVVGNNGSLESDKTIIGRAYLTEMGISERENTELMAKLKPKMTPDFDLDLSKSKPASYFEQKMADAAPKPRQEK